MVVVLIDWRAGRGTGDNAIIFYWTDTIAAIQDGLHDHKVQVKEEIEHAVKRVRTLTDA